MSKLLIVFGSTGQQGSSVISHVLSDPVLSSQYTIRAITRTPTSAAAQSLKSQYPSIQIVQADLDDPTTLPPALSGAHTVFAVTTTNYGPALPGYTKELGQGKALADAAVASGASYIIWSSSTNVKEATGGKLPNVSLFDVKADVEKYIRGLPIQSAFFTPGSFMQNFYVNGRFAPEPVGDGTWAIKSILKPDTELPLIDIAGDTGKYVCAILASPEEYAGKVFAAATRMYTVEETVRIISEVTGKKVVYQELGLEEHRGTLPEGAVERIEEMLLWFRDYGYYGPGSREKVEWTARQVAGRGRLTEFREFVERNPMKLE